MGKLNFLLSPPQRKLLVTWVAMAALSAGFGVVVWKPTALDAYKTFAEWTVYLAGFFGGANALAYWAQRPPKAPQASKDAPGTTQAG